MKKQKERPGFFIWHDMLPTFRKMSPETVGRFVLAMGAYSESGVAPDFSDDIRADTLWDQTWPRMNASAENYQNRIDSGAYAGWCSSLKDAGKEYAKVPFDDWKLAREEYEEYLKQRQGHPVELFTDWLLRGQERAEQAKDVALPWELEDTQ